MSIEIEDDTQTLCMVSEYDKARKGTDLDTPALLCGVEKADGENRTRVIASTASVDRAGDIVEQDWQLANFRRNPVILWMHDRMAAPVGRAAEVKTTERGKGGQLEMVIEWDAGEHNPQGTLVGAQYARGFLHAVSVGFRPGKRIRRADLPKDDPRHQALKDGEPAWMSGLVLSRNELIENSAVTIPANPEALAVRSWAVEVEDPTQQVARVLSETVSKADAEWLMRALEHPDIRRKLQAIAFGLPAIPDEGDDFARLFEPRGLAHLFPAPAE